MGKDQLMQLIEAKGNERKKAMLHVTQMQTKDWYNTSELKKKMLEEMNRLRSEQQQWLQQQQQQQQEGQEEDQLVRQLEQNLKLKE